MPVTEIPHIDTEKQNITHKGKKVSVIDLKLETYPQQQKDALMKMFYARGLVGELEGKMLLFKKDNTVEVLDDIRSRGLPRMPDGWEKKAAFAYSSGNPTMTEVFNKI